MSTGTSRRRQDSHLCLENQSARNESSVRDSRRGAHTVRRESAPIGCSTSPFPSPQEGPRIAHCRCHLRIGFLTKFRIFAQVIRIGQWWHFLVNEGRS